MALSFEFVSNCKPGDLLRVKIEDTAEFAILGASEGHGFQRAQTYLRTQQPDHRQHVDHGRSDMRPGQSLDLCDRCCRFPVFLKCLALSPSTTCALARAESAGYCAAANTESASDPIQPSVELALSTQSDRSRAPRGWRPRPEVR